MVTRPSAMDELLARIEAVHQRTADKPAMTLSAGGLQLSLSNKRGTLHERTVDLTPTEFSILELLMGCHGQVVTRKMLCEHVWGFDWVGPDERHRGAHQPPPRDQPPHATDRLEYRGRAADDRDDAAGRPVCVAEMKRKAESHEKRGWFMHLLTQEGTTIWKSKHCPEAVSSFPPLNLDREENIAQVGPYRYVRLRLVRAGEPTYHIRVGTYTTGLDASLGNLMRELSALGLVLSLLTPLVAYWLAGRATRPIGSILETAVWLRPTRLGDRLPVRGTRDELDRLSETINGLLDSVADHVEQQEQFVADAAHELRGSLAALQSSLEVAMSHDHATPEQHDRLGDMLEVSRHLSKITNDLLLLLAERGGESRPVSVAVHDITVLVGQAVGMFAGATEDKGVSLNLVVHGPVMVVGEAADLRRVASNLLDNAIRFTPAGGRVEVRITEAPGPGGGVLTVLDTGVGIAPADLAHVFGRFYKADPSRSHGGTGRSGGLGLAICKSIIESCGGTIAIVSRVGEGTTVTVRLPAPRRATVSVRAHSTDV